jgi:glucokinase
VELLARAPWQTTLLESYAAGDPHQITGRTVAAAARDGDPVAVRAMGELARWFGEGLALVADVYDPELIVVGGGVSESAPLFLDEAREHYATVVTGAGHRPLARIRTAQLGGDAGIVGAAALARDLVTDR